MRACVLERHGGPEELREREVATPLRGPGELLVRVRACGVCGHDLLARRGALSTALPQILGHEIAGEIAEGDERGSFAPGDRVVLNQRMACGVCSLCMAGHDNRCVSGLGFYGEGVSGGYAEYVRALPSNTVPLPDEIAFESGAALPCGVGTGLHALRRTRLRAGETVLVTGAGGAVGLNAVAIAAGLGARVIGVVRGPGKARAVREAGAAEVVLASDGSFAAQVRGRCGGADAALECVGTPTLGETVRSLRAGGRVALVGNVEPVAFTLALGGLILKEIELFGSSHATVRELREAVALVASGTLVPALGEVMDLGQAARAHERLDAGQTVGKFVLTA